MAVSGPKKILMKKDYRDRASFSLFSSPVKFDDYPTAYSQDLQDWKSQLFSVEFCNSAKNHEFCSKQVYIFLGQMSPLIGDARKMKKWWCFIVDRILNSFTPISYQANIFVINMVLILIFREYNFSEVYFDWFFSKSVFWHWSFTMFLSNSPICNEFTSVFVRQDFDQNLTFF